MNEPVTHEVCNLRAGQTEKRVQKHGEQIDDIKECVIKLTQLTEQHSLQITEHDKRIKQIENAPSRLWGMIINALIVAGASILLAVIYRR